MTKRSSLIALASATGLAANMAFAAGGRLANLKVFNNPTGAARTYSTLGDIDLNNPFFQSLGTNGRSCVTCHDPSAGWTITPQLVQTRFDATGGEDPLFRSNDGANWPSTDLSSPDSRRANCSMLLNKGLIRVGLPIPAGAEFELAEVDDPYGYASAAELSLFRRPLPATNLRFLSAVMWDGRENVLAPGADPTIALSLHSGLGNQANDATLGHAQAGQSLTPQQKQQIVALEMSLTTAQTTDKAAGDLGFAGQGGPFFLFGQSFYLGVNDPLGHNPQQVAFNPRAFTLFDGWKTSSNARRKAVYRGQELFNTHPITITGVKGLNDDLGLPSIQGTCTTCHDTPNVGNHSAIAPLDIGLTDESRRTPDMPLYTLRRLAPVTS